jgi:hypothetical protein
MLLDTWNSVGCKTGNPLYVMSVSVNDDDRGPRTATLRTVAAIRPTLVTSIRASTRYTMSVPGHAECDDIQVKRQYRTFSSPQASGLEQAHSGQEDPYDGN